MTSGGARRVRHPPPRNASGKQSAITRRDRLSLACTLKDGVRDASHPNLPPVRRYTVDSSPMAARLCRAVCTAPEEAKRPKQSFSFGGYTMTKNTFSFEQDVLDIIASREENIAGLKASNAENTDAANGMKIHCYADLIAEICKIPFTSKNKLPVYASKAIKDALEIDCGLKAAVSKKYLENSQAAVRHFGLPTGEGSNVTADAVLSDFAEAGITSEAKLRKVVCGDDAKSLEDLLVEKVVGRETKTGNISDAAALLNDFDNRAEEIEALTAFVAKLTDAVHRKHDIREAAQAAADEADTVENVVEAFAAE